MLGAVGEQHDQPVDADAFARGRRQAVLQRADVVGVVVHGLVVAGFLLPHLFAEARGLVLRIVELGEAVRDFAPGDVELEAFGDLRMPVARARERAHLGRVVDDEGGLEQELLDQILEQRELERADAVLRANLDAQRAQLADEKVAVVQVGVR